MKLVVAFLASVAVLLAALVDPALSVDAANADIVITNAARTVDLSSQLVKMKNALTLKNGGSGAVKSVHFVVEKELADKVVFIGATQDKTHLRVAETKLTADKNLPAWRVELKSALAAGAEAKIDVEVVLGKAVEMYPKEITQSEKQLVRFVGNHYVLSPYKVKAQTTKFQLPSSTVESYTKTLKPNSKSDKTISYGPYNDVKPLTFVSLLYTS